MNEQAIKNLRDALKYSPDNIPLKLHLADILTKNNRLDEAESEYKEILAKKNSTKAKLGLAGIYYKQEQFSKSIVVLESMVQEGVKDFDVLILYARVLLKEEAIAEAAKIYKEALKLEPDFRDDELDGKLRLNSGGAQKNDSDEEDDEYTQATHFVQKPSINFSDVGGMENIKKEIDLKIIKPLLHADLYKAYGKKTGGGILLYGPPGCGKTFIAKATAGQVNAKFISVGLNDILDMWMGNSEKNLHKVFEKARQNAPCVLFFDEIDALGASRSDMRQSSSRHLINHFLQELDGMENSNDGVLVLGATNAPWHLDSAFRRPGRFDRIIFVPPPDTEAREAILKLKLRDKPIDTIDYSGLAKKTQNFSGADIEAIIDIAIEQKLEESFGDGVPKPICTKDIVKSLKRHKASTSEWFATAKNFALYANESGLYDDILNYLNIKK